MKNSSLQYIMLTLILLLLFNNPNNLKASIPNNDFEVWKTDTLFEDLNDLFTLNSAYYYEYNGIYNVSRSSDYVNGNSSAKLETIVSNSGDTLFAAAGNVNIITQRGGFPVSTKPDSITGYYKYDIKTGDTAAIIVVLGLQGVPIGFTEIIITGTQNNFTRFSYQIDPTFIPGMTPDTIVFAFLSSYSEKPLPGSVLYMDQYNIKVGTNNIYSGNFSDWKQHIYEYPEFWWTSDLVSVPVFETSGVSRTNDSYKGNFAAKITTFYFEEEFVMGLLGNFDIIYENYPKGFPLNDRPYSLKGNYKSLPVSDDTASVAVIFQKWDSINGYSNIVHFVLHNLPASSQYDSFEIPLKILPNLDYDSVLMFFSASNIFIRETASIGSELYIDNLSFNFEFPLLPPSEKPVLISPANNSIGIDTHFVDFQWQGVNLATHYALEISDDAGFSNIIYSEDSIVATSHIAQISFEAETKYYWQVKARNNSGEGPYSDVWNFTTLTQLTKPDITELFSPDSNASEVIIEDTEFKWYVTEYAEYYYFQLADDAAFNNILLEADSIQDTFYISQIILDNNTNYYWRVFAYNQSGNGLWSNIWKFTTLQPTALIISGTHDNKINLYPVPASQFINIEGKILKDKNLDILITDLSGKVLLEKDSISYNENIPEVQLDISHLSPGTYIVLIKYNSVVINKKLLKK